MKAAKNLLIDHYKSASNRREVVTNDFSARAARGEGPQSKLEMAETEDEFSAAIEGLNLNMRTVVYMIDVDKSIGT